MDAVVDPVVLAVVEPVVDAVVDPVVLAVVEPVVDAVVDPVVLAVVEPVVLWLVTQEVYALNWESHAPEATALCPSESHVTFATAQLP